MKNTDAVWDFVEAKQAPFIELANRVFDTPETLYGEFKSAAEHVRALEAQGFRITREPAGIPTAVIGEAGDSGPVIAILGEYDALPGLSQESGVPTYKPVQVGGNGHGCGHNLLGSAALLAATAVKDWLAETGIKARVRYYGCPAEEGGAAKTYLVRDGYFDDVDAAISWHPASHTGVWKASSLANSRIDFTFSGKAAHAAAAPDLGRSALDACELMSVGVNYMREHMPDDARVHYAYLDAGGAAPNVVQAKATVRHLIRARDLPGLRALIARVQKIAEGAALMTGTTMESKVYSGVSNLLGNTPLEQAMQRVLEGLGPVPFDDADRAFAREIRKTYTEDDILSTFHRLGMEPDMELDLCDFIVPLDNPGSGAGGSTDVGDVSWAVPTVQTWVATCAIGTPAHSWQLTAHGKTPVAHKGMIHAAKVMAGTAKLLIEDPSILAAAQEEHRKHLARTPYVCPIPKEATPPILRQAA